MRNFISKITPVALLLVVLFFGLKSCVITVWSSPEVPTTFGIHGKDGRSLSLILLPGNEAITLYTENNSGSIEAAYTKMRGTYGSHYFWRLWNVNLPGAGLGLPGYRIYPEGSKPVVMETTILKKFSHGTTTPKLKTEGSTTTSILLFTDDSIEFEGMWLNREPTNENLVKSLIEKLSTPNR